VSRSHDPERRRAEDHRGPERQTADRLGGDRRPDHLTRCRADACGGSRPSTRTPR
jgi:hypothetical protein